MHTFRKTACNKRMWTCRECVASAQRQTGHAAVGKFMLVTSWLWFSMREETSPLELQRKKNSFMIDYKIIVKNALVELYQVVR